MHRARVQSVMLTLLLLCSCRSFYGPSDSAVHDATETFFASSARYNSDYQICSGDLSTNALNKEVQGKEAMVRVEVTWHTKFSLCAFHCPPPSCNPKTDTFDLRFVNRDGKWVLAQ